MVHGVPVPPTEVATPGPGRRILAMGATRMVDRTRPEEFVGKAVDDFEATIGAALVGIGDKLGLYEAMAGAGTLTAAERTG
jgi:hypothetical protein